MSLCNLFTYSNHLKNVLYVNIHSIGPPGYMTSATPMIVIVARFYLKKKHNHKMLKQCRKRFKKFLCLNIFYKICWFYKLFVMNPCHTACSYIVYLMSWRNDDREKSSEAIEWVWN